MVAPAHDESLDVELARIQAEADVKIAEAKGRATAGPAPAAVAPDPTESTQTWDEFWEERQRVEAAERGEARTEVIRGVEIVVPHDLPLRFQRRLEQIQDAEKRLRARVSDTDARIAELEAAKAAGVDVDDTLASLRAAAEAIGKEESERAAESTRGLLGDLFGADVLDRWIDGGMTETELQVVLLWGMAHGKGQPMTHQQAYDAYRRAEGKAPAGAAAPARSSKPNARKKPRAATGGPSKRTSAGSTSSARATSRTSRSASS